MAVHEKVEHVWVAYRKSGCEGCSEPLRVFTSESLAMIWYEGANDTYGSGAALVKLPLVTGDAS